MQFYSCRVENTGRVKKILGASKILGESKNNWRVQGAEGAYEYWARKAGKNCHVRNIGHVGCVI